MKGLTATIDGTKVEPFALVDVDAKEHVISVAADGYFPVEKKTVAVDGQSTFVEVELKPKPASVAVKTEDDARITIDGRSSRRHRPRRSSSPPASTSSRCCATAASRSARSSRSSAARR